MLASRRRRAALGVHCSLSSTSDRRELASICCASSLCLILHRAPELRSVNWLWISALAWASCKQSRCVNTAVVLKTTRPRVKKAQRLCPSGNPIRGFLERAYRRSARRCARQRGWRRRRRQSRLLTSPTSQGCGTAGLELVGHYRLPAKPPHALRRAVSFIAAALCRLPLRTLAGEAAPQRRRRQRSGVLDDRQSLDPAGFAELRQRAPAPAAISLLGNAPSAALFARAAAPIAVRRSRFPPHRATARPSERLPARQVKWG